MQEFLNNLIKSFSIKKWEKEHKTSEEADEKSLILIPGKDKCDHGIFFDEKAAQELLDNAIVDPNLDLDVAFVLGNPASLEIRKRWPRLNGLCPLGCGFNGIYYASFAHYTMGDW